MDSYVKDIAEDNYDEEISQTQVWIKWKFELTLLFLVPKLPNPWYLQIL